MTPTNQPINWRAKGIKIPEKEKLMWLELLFPVKCKQKHITEAYFTWIHLSSGFTVRAKVTEQQMLKNGFGTFISCDETRRLLLLLKYILQDDDDDINRPRRLLTLTATPQLETEIERRRERETPLWEEWLCSGWWVIESNFSEIESRVFAKISIQCTGGGGGGGE